MNDFDNTNRGAAWKNKEKLETWHADYRGKLNVGGVDHWLDVYVTNKEGQTLVDKDGNRYFQVRVKEKSDAPQESKQPEPVVSQDAGDDFDDSRIPF